MRKKYFVFGFQKENVFVACWNGFLVNSCYFLALLNLSEKIMFEELRRSWRKTLMLLFVSFFFLNTLLFSKLESFSSKKEQKKKKKTPLIPWLFLSDYKMSPWSVGFPLWKKNMTEINIIIEFYPSQLLLSCVSYAISIFFFPTAICLHVYK